MVDAVIIMAGGRGTRLWPASVEDSPKQFLPVEGEKNLLDLALERAFACNPNTPVFIVTGERYMEKTLSCTDKLEKNRKKQVRVVGEPAGKNTAPAIMLGMLMAEKECGNCNVLVLTADHLIKPLDAFVADVEKAVELSASGYHVAFGIRPSAPETGYGYIHVGEKIMSGRRVLEFKEKPDELTALAYLKDGSYLWNSGMFVFNSSLFVRELEKLSPDVAAAFLDADMSVEHDYRDGVSLYYGGDLPGIYAKTESISVDYALMEKTSLACVVEAGFEWSDVGSWDEYASLASVTGQVFEAESSGCTVLSDVPVALCGVDNLVVVFKNNRLLVLKKGKGQLVRDAAEFFDKRK
ncbi:mannose-1-phosphate guanylyltransferase [Spirochaetia bacterium 38H-sp]|uniref:Mannose-1-phosphate guanylyltransferase n=1 Tax=Rarispira pelagica TaxID=3141764 RepID=A0ABU9U9L8_9SPIR